MSNNTNPFAILENFKLGETEAEVHQDQPPVRQPIQVIDEPTPEEGEEHPKSDHVQLEPVTAKPIKISLLNRILEAFGVAQVYATQIEDPAHRAEQEERLLRSNVHGSSVMNIRSVQDVENMFSAASNYVELQANLRQPNITVIQGFLRPGTIAFAAYATVREFAAMYGQTGLNEVKWKIGHQTADDYYASSVARFPTRLLTVQLKNDPETNVEQLHQWFAGPEISSLVRKNDGDVLIRCGVQLQPVSQQVKHKPVYRRQQHHQR